MIAFLSNDSPWTPAGMTATSVSSAAIILHSSDDPNSYESGYDFNSSGSMQNSVLVDSATINEGQSNG